MTTPTVAMASADAAHPGKAPGTHTLHDLRHTFGTRMAAGGVPMRTLQEWMGHRHITTTERYADYAPSLHEHSLIEAASAAPKSALNLPSISPDLSEPERT